MASSVDDTPTLVSQESTAVVSQVHTEPIDVSRMSGASLAAFIRLHGNPDDERENGENDPISIAAAVATGGEAGVEAEAGNAEAAEAVAINKEAPPAKKRRRMAFGSKKLLANRHLFLLPQHQNQHGDDSARIQGKIMKCATKKDRNSKFVIDWKKPFPAGVNSLWLRKAHDNTDEHRDKLQEAILECEALNPTITKGEKRSTSSNKTPKAATRIHHPSVIAAALVRTGSNTCQRASCATFRRDPYTLLHERLPTDSARSRTMQRHWDDLKSIAQQELTLSIFHTMLSLIRLVFITSHLVYYSTMTSLDL